MSTYESMEILGTTADSLESLLAATQLPMPAEVHLQAIKLSLPALIKKLRDVYVIETGDNPWE